MTQENIAAQSIVVAQAAPPALGAPPQIGSPAIGAQPLGAAPGAFPGQAVSPLKPTVPGQYGAGATGLSGTNLSGTNTGLATTSNVKSAIVLSDKEKPPIAFLDPYMGDGFTILTLYICFSLVLAVIWRNVTRAFVSMGTGKSFDAARLRHQGELELNRNLLSADSKTRAERVWLVEQIEKLGGRPCVDTQPRSASALPVPASSSQPPGPASPTSSSSSSSPEPDGRSSISELIFASLKPSGPITQTAQPSPADRFLTALNRG